MTVSGVGQAKLHNLPDFVRDWQPWAVQGKGGREGWNERGRDGGRKEGKEEKKKEGVAVKMDSETARQRYIKWPVWIWVIKVCPYCVTMRQHPASAFEPAVSSTRSVLPHITCAAKPFTCCGPSLKCHRLSEASWPSYLPSLPTLAAYLLLPSSAEFFSVFLLALESSRVSQNATAQHITNTLCIFAVYPVHSLSLSLKHMLHEGRGFCVSVTTATPVRRAVVHRGNLSICA